MKKLIAGISALALTISMMAGCSSGNANSGSSGESAGNSESTNVISSKEDLVGKTIGVQLGTTGMELAESIEGTNVEKYNKYADAIQALIQGKVDAVIIDSAPGKYFVEKNSETITSLDEPYATEEYAIAIKKDNDELTDKINTALAELKEDGTLAEIEKNWLVDEEYGKHPYTSPEGIEYTGTLTMATNAEFPPYELKENNEIVGFDVDMMTAVCDKLGYELVVDDMAFDSVVTSVVTGKADVGVAGMTVTEDRLKNVNFSDPYTTANQIVVVRK